jgi:hypothetical protein
VRFQIENLTASEGTPRPTAGPRKEGSLASLVGMFETKREPDGVTVIPCRKGNTHPLTFQTGREDQRRGRDPQHRSRHTGENGQARGQGEQANACNFCLSPSLSLQCLFVSLSSSPSAPQARGHSCCGGRCYRERRRRCILRPRPGRSGALCGLGTARESERRRPHPLERSLRLLTGRCLYLPRFAEEPYGRPVCHRSRARSIMCASYTKMRMVQGSTSNGYCWPERKQRERQLQDAECENRLGKKKKVKYIEDPVAESFVRARCRPA